MTHRDKRKPRKPRKPKSSSTAQVDELFRCLVKMGGMGLLPMDNSTLIEELPAPHRIVRKVGHA